MGKTEEYRRFAAECLKMASETEDENARASFLLMAQVWARLADQKADAGTARKD
jgi:hypothetical protein